MEGVDVLHRPIRVAVHATDPLSRAGLVGLLSGRAEVTVVRLPEPTPDVLVVSVPRLGVASIELLRRLATEVGVPTVLVTSDVTERQLVALVKYRIVSVLPVAAATGERLTQSVTAAAAGGAILPARMVGYLIAHINHLMEQRRVMDRRYPGSRAGLAPGEVDVLRLVAEGLDTDKIAVMLSSSTRAVQNRLYVLTRRLGLRNRSHAVAYAIRAGVL